MKIIKITDDSKISMHEFPTGTISEQNEALIELIGSECQIYERVKPRRLYSHFGCSVEPGNCISILVDEEGHYHNLKINTVGSFLYETDKHGYPILGTILVVKEHWNEGDIVFSGIPDGEFEELYKKFEEVIERVGA